MRKTALLGLGALVAVSALFLACGGGGNDNGASNDSDGGNGSGAELQNVRIQKGLSVANLGSGGNLPAGDGADSAGLKFAGAGAGGAANTGGAPAADRAAAGGVGGSGGDTVSSQQTGTTDNTGITVNGYGSATADADSAIVEFGFSSTGSGGYEPYPPYGVRPDGSTAEPITRETLQPMIDALVAAGVSADDIEVLGNSYYYDYYSSYATLRATINNLGILDGAVQAAQGAAGGISSIYLNSTNVMYTLQNCEALERAAAQAAVEDAADRAALLADVLDVTLGSVAGASDYSWYNSGTGCGSDYYSPWPIAYSIWRPGTSGDGTVQVVSNISVTYAFN
jgi:uncharacterized protein YggE